jgi:hypothetical protein
MKEYKCDICGRDLCTHNLIQPFEEMMLIGDRAFCIPCHTKKAEQNNKKRKKENLEV